MEDLFAQKDVGSAPSLRCSNADNVPQPMSLFTFACSQMEEAELRSWIEKLQARLQVCGVDSPQQLQVVLESLVMKKQGLCETLQSWNSRSASRFNTEL